jgi:hypothetical protein
MTAPPIPGYVRCGVTFAGAEWKIEVLDEQERIAIVDIETDEGTLSFALHRASAEDLKRTLELFLQDWPKDQAAS